MKYDANLIGLANLLHLAVEEAVFGKSSLPLDFLLDVFALALFLAHVSELQLVADGKVLEVMLTWGRGVFDARLDEILAEALGVSRRDRSSA